MCSQRHIKQRAQPSGAPPTARPSKCTISSVTRAWSGMTTLKPRQRSTHVLEHAQTHHGIPVRTKDARNSTSDSARNSRARHPARPSKCTISSTVRARSGAPTHTTAETSRARALNMQRRITGSLCTQTVCARNMLHLKTLGRETNLSSTKILHIERHTGREWRIHPHMHRNTPHAYFGPAQTPPWTPLHSKRAHNIRHLRERAHLLDERATSRSSKCIISSAAPVLSSVLMHTPVGTLRTRALAMPKACREPFAVIYGARNGTSHSARTRV